MAIELQTEGGLVGIVHADVPGTSWPAFVEALENPALSAGARERLIDQAQWSRDRIDKLFRDEVAGVRAVVVGHTPVERITTLGNVHYIDTAAWKGGNANPAMTKQSGEGEDKRDSGGQQAAGGTSTGDDAPVRYYESIDLVDAFHPQTILAFELNGKALPVANGAPLRLRLERNLGYKQAKYVMRIEVLESFADIGEGKGGYWEDQGYAWYAGI